MLMREKDSTKEGRVWEVENKQESLTFRDSIHALHTFDRIWHKLLKYVHSQRRIRRLPTPLYPT